MPYLAFVEDPALPKARRVIELRRTAPPNKPIGSIMNDSAEGSKTKAVWQAVVDVDNGSAGQATGVTELLCRVGTKQLGGRLVSMGVTRFLPLG